MVFCSGCSAVRLAHLLWEQGVDGSNPFTPTKREESLNNFPLIVYTHGVSSKCQNQAIKRRLAG